MNVLRKNEFFAFIKVHHDVHTLGLASMANLLQDSGYKTIIAPKEIQRAVADIQKFDNFVILKNWLIKNGITRISFSYRLDPNDGKDFFCKLFYALKESKSFIEDGGFIRGISFAGLPDACDLVQNLLGNSVLYYPGDESPIEALTKQGVAENDLPKTLLQTNEYDRVRMDFARRLISSEKYKKQVARKRDGYAEYGTKSDSYLERLAYCKSRHTLPIIRAHVGPYQPNRVEAINMFLSWINELKSANLLDVLSIGTSQLSQSNFGEEWGDKKNGGGVPINSELEFRAIAQAASPMLIRTYAGTKDVPTLAKMYEETINICWHALSFWWFCEIDGRGENTVLENLRQHFETVKYIASTGKPLEPNVPHHFAFRGGDDLSYVISAYLAAKVAKKLGIKHLILQNMLNTPKQTWGVQDIAKGRAMLKIVKELECDDFKVSLQTRAGLDYLSPDLEKAKMQLASVTALMDDIDPLNEFSPEIIHVVSYSEAVRLATPPIINESIQITLSALEEYRSLRRSGKVENMAYEKESCQRTSQIYEEAKEAINVLETSIKNLYSPQGFCRLFEDGFFPVPYLQDEMRKYPKATNYTTALKNGGVRVVNENGDIIYTPDRFRSLL